jgi:hypothetical protein
MEDVDFTDAELLWVEFRNLAMNRIRWPQHPANETFEHYPCVLERAISALRTDGRPDALGIAGAFENELKWMHPERRTGVVHRDELAPLEDETIALMRDAERECARG